MLPRSGTLTATGRLIHAGKTNGVSTVEVTDNAGRLLTTASTRCTLQPRIEARPDVVEQALLAPLGGPPCGVPWNLWGMP